MQSLRSKILFLSAIPTEKKTSEEYYHAITQINELLIGYFAVVDHDFIFSRQREKIQKLLEIHSLVFEYKNLAENAEIYCREYIACTKDEDGIRNYSEEKFHEDLKPFDRATNNFRELGQPFAIYLDLRIREYHALILKG